MSAHTPGPWTADRKGKQGIANYTVIGTPANWHVEIARVYHGQRDVDGEANARLIAAAPDLIAALRSIVKAWEALPGGRAYNPLTIATWLQNEMSPAIDAARELLAPQESS